MKRVTVCVSVSIAIHMVLVAEANPGSVKYVGPTDGAWGQDEHWQDEQTGQNRKPTLADTAHIPKNASCKMTALETGECASLQIDGPTQELDTSGVLKIERGCTLKVYGAGATSVVNGEVRFVAALPQTDPVIELQDNHVFIRTAGNPASPPRILGDVRGIIRGNDANDLLTLGDPEDNNAALQIVGDIDIEIKLDNYGVVEATHPFRQDPKPRIVLKTNPKLGSGKWKATAGELIVDVGVSGAGKWEAGNEGLIQINATVVTSAGCYFQALRAGKLEVNATVTGPAAWILGINSDDTAPGIEINTACTGLTGSFTMGRGLFDVQAGFCSDGQAALYSNSSTWGAVINVAENVVLKFSGNCP